MRQKRASNHARRPPGFYPRAFAQLGSAHSFLFHLTGLEPETDAVSLDHAYSKPWSAHPEASMAKSMVTLFMTPGVRTTNSLTSQCFDRDGWKDPFIETVDVESVEPPPAAAYDVPKARSAMKECEGGLPFLREHEIGDDDWEDKLNKSGWTSSQTRLFNRVVRELTSDRLGRLAIAGSDDEPLQLRLLVDKTAKRFRQILATVQWEKKMCAWLHRITLDFIPTSLLVAYLDILQALKGKIPTLIDRLLCGVPLPSTGDLKQIPKSPPPTPKSPPHPSPKSPPLSHSLPTGVVDPESLAALLKRPWDPLAGLFVQHRLRKIPANPIILLAPDAPSNLSSGLSTKRKKFWHNQLAALGKIIPITAGLHSSSGSSCGGGAHAGAAAQQSLENMINAMRAKVCDLREHYAPQERPIVLMGWGVGALVCVHVALVEQVSAVVCLGFPFLGIGGSRGDVEDPFLDLRTPTLFVLGQQAPLSPLADVEDLREKIKAETSLVLVGGADDQLRMCRRKKKMEGITQSIVDRVIQDEVLDFLLNVFAAASSHENAPVAAPKSQNNNNNNSSSNNSNASNGASQGHSTVGPGNVANVNAKAPFPVSSTSQSGAPKPRKRPNNRVANPAVTRVASAGDVRRDPPTSMMMTTTTTSMTKQPSTFKKTVLDASFLGTAVGVSKPAPEISPSSSDTSLNRKPSSGASHGMMMMMTTTTMMAASKDSPPTLSASAQSPMNSGVSSSSSISSPSSFATEASGGCAPRLLVSSSSSSSASSKGGNAPAGNMSGANGSRGKSKAKKQGGGSKKVPKLTNTAATVGSLNVGDASKVYGLSTQGSSSTLRPTVGSTVLNPVLTQQFVSGIPNLGTQRTAAASQPEAPTNSIQKVVRDDDLDSKSNALTTHQQKLMGTLLAASTNFNPQIGLAGGNLSSFMNPAHVAAAAAAAAAASGNSVPPQMLAVSSTKQLPPSSLSVLRPQISRGASAPSLSPSQLQSSQPSSHARPSPGAAAGGASVAARPKAPATGFPNAANSVRTTNLVRQPVSLKRPSILQQATPEINNGGEQNLEELRRQVKISARSSDKSIRPPPPPNSPSSTMSTRQPPVSSSPSPIRPPLPSPATRPALPSSPSIRNPPPPSGTSIRSSLPPPTASIRLSLAAPPASPSQRAAVASPSRLLSHASKSSSQLQESRAAPASSTLSSHAVVKSISATDQKSTSKGAVTVNAASTATSAAAPVMDLNPQQMLRKSVITSAVKQNPSS